jgi:hypothetical protein
MAWAWAVGKPVRLPGLDHAGGGAYAPPCRQKALRKEAPAMRTEIYESDPFTAQKQALLVTLDTPYRFERNDELFISTGNRTMKVRVIHVRVEITDGQMRREILVLKL